MWGRYGAATDGLPTRTLGNYLLGLGQTQPLPSMCLACSLCQIRFSTKSFGRDAAAVAARAIAAVSGVLRDADISDVIAGRPVGVAGVSSLQSQNKHCQPRTHRTRRSGIYSCSSWRSWLGAQGTGGRGLRQVGRGITAGVALCVECRGVLRQCAEAGVGEGAELISLGAEESPGRSNVW